MTATFSITIDDTPLADALARTGAALGDLSDLMDQIGAALLANVQDRFVSSTEPDGLTMWPESRAAKERGGKTLVRKGHLRDSVVYALEPNAVEVGSNLIYAAIHQFGGTIRPVTADALWFRLPNGALIKAAQVTLPARPYLGIGPADERDIIDLTEAYIARAFTT